MDHSRAAKLDPAGAFARAASFAFEFAGAVAFEAREIEFRRRLGKREVGRPKTRDRIVAEHSLEPFGDGAFEMGHRDAFVDAETFELMKHRRVRHVRRVAAKNLTRCENAERHAAAFHRADLYGRCLRSKSKPVGRIKRVLRFAGRMSLRNIQSVEIVIIGLDLAVILDRVTHRNENVLDLLPQNRDRMQMPGSRTAAGKCYVQPFAFRLRVRNRDVESGFGARRSAM